HIEPQDQDGGQQGLMVQFQQRYPSGHHRGAIGLLFVWLGNQAEHLKVIERSIPACPPAAVLHRHGLPLSPACSGQAITSCGSEAGSVKGAVGVHRSAAETLDRFCRATMLLKPGRERTLPAHTTVLFAFFGETHVERCAGLWLLLLAEVSVQLCYQPLGLPVSGQTMLHTIGQYLLCITHLPPLVWAMALL